jgi:hypothetical protein
MILLLGGTLGEALPLGEAWGLGLGLTVDLGLGLTVGRGLLGLELGVG